VVAQIIVPFAAHLAAPHEQGRVVGTVLYRSLPRVAPTTLSYPQLLASVLALAREEPVLRVRMVLGTLVFASFSTFWASAGFLLARPPYSWNSAAIGAFAMVGVAGAVMAKVAGRLADRGHARLVTGGFLLVLGVAVMDLGCQGAHLSNQSMIYRLRPGAHSRINTAYMTSYFLGGALGSGLSSIMVYPRFGWTGVCVLGGAFPAIGLVIWCVDVRSSQQ
jgi:hypothetical protein